MSKQPTTIKLSDLHQDPKNANKGTERGASMLAGSIAKHRAGRSILVDKNGLTIAGNKTLKEAIAAGITDGIVVKTSGDQLVVVQREDLDLVKDASAKELALADNRIAEANLFWDADILKDFAAEDVKLDDLWSAEELSALFGEPEIIAGAGGDEFDSTPQEGETIAQRGDVWQCGRHRVMCGDSTNPLDIERLTQGEKAGLILTDPPYAVDYVAKARDMNRRGYVHSRATLSAAIAGDGIEQGQEEDFWRDVFSIADAVLTENAAWYIWHAPERAGTLLYNLLAEIGLLHHQTIIWVKNNFVIGRCDYQWKHETCFYGWKTGNRPPFYGERNQTSIWDISRDTNAPLHPTQKPVELFAIPMRNHLAINEIIYDPFLGSGTSLIAAHRTGRICYGIDIEPKYIDVALRRYEAETNEKPTLLTRIEGAAA